MAGVTEVNVIAGAVVSLVAVLTAVAVLPAASCAVAVNVMVPSAKLCTSMPVAVQLPDESTVALKVPLVPLALSVATIVTVAPISVVPVAETLVAELALIGFGVIDVKVVVGATVSFVAVLEAVPVLPAASFEVAVKVIVPSFRLVHVQSAGRPVARRIDRGGNRGNRRIGAVGGHDRDRGSGPVVPVTV